MKKENQSQVIELYRYEFKLKDSDNVNVKYIADTAEGHTAFVEQLKTLGVEVCVRSYVSSFEVSKILNICETVFKEEKENEKKTDERK